MANEKISQLPGVVASAFSDIFPAVQGGVTSQESLQQVFNLMLANTILNNAGNPNGAVAGVVYQLCWDKTNNLMYVCTTAGSAATAVWTPSHSFATPISVANGGTGLATITAHGIMIGEGTGNVNAIALSNGQLPIGSTGADPVAANITAGSGISISNGAGSITIAATGSAPTGWTDVTGISQAMVADGGYVADNAGLVTLTLPATAAFGTSINVVGKGSGGWTIAQNAGQSIHMGSSSSTVGAGGSISSTNQFDSVCLVCITANTTWASFGGPQGNITIV